MDFAKMICLISVVLGVVLLEVSHTASAERLGGRRLDVVADTVAAADALDDLEYQILLEELANIPEARRNRVSKRGFVRLG